jgi:hypothetical protein
MALPTIATPSTIRTTSVQWNELLPKSNGNTCQIRSSATIPTAVVTVSPRAFNQDGSRTRYTMFAARFTTIEALTNPMTSGMSPVRNGTASQPGQPLAAYSSAALTSTATT